MIEYYKKLNKYLLIFTLMTVVFMYGVLCNYQVIVSNQGKMPVLLDYEYNSTTHFGFSDFNLINYPYLADIIKTNLFGYSFHFSIGDIIMILALLGLTINAALIIKNYLKWTKKIS